MKRFRKSILILLMASLGLSGFLYAATTSTESLPLGSAAPNFSLQDVVTGKTVSLSDCAGKKALLVMFICRHCPYVQHVKKQLAQIGKDYAGKDVSIVAISANDPAAYQEDAPNRLKEMVEEDGFLFPLLFDETQEVAKAYTAAATPELFLFDQSRKLVYHGQVDDTRPGSGQESTGKDIREAIDAVLDGKPVSANQKPAIGCSIKWKS